MPELSPTGKRLRLAFTKLKQDEKSGGPKPNISAVARAAGVSHTLIHTKYPELAKEIRKSSGRGPDEQLKKLYDQLKLVERRLAELRNELKDVKGVNRGLASENARLTLLVVGLEKEVAALEAGARPLRRRRRNEDGLSPEM